MERSGAVRHRASPSDRSGASRHPVAVAQLAESELLEILRTLTLREPEAKELLAELQRHVEDLRYLMRIREL